MKNLLQAEGTNKAILLSMSMSIFAKVFNFAQSLVASYAFGTQTSTDILFYMLSLVILLSTLISSVNQQVIVPNAIYIRTNRSEEDSRKFISFIYLIYLAVGVTGTAVLMVMPERILSVFSKFTMENILDNMAILRFIIPTFALIIANTFILDIFTAYRYFTLPMLLDMLKNVLIILMVLLLKDSLSVTSLALGVLAGNLAQFLLLNVMLFFRLQCRPTFRPYPLSREIRGNIGYVVGGFATAFASSFVVMYLMSGFPSGVFSATDYAQKISTVFSMAIVGQIVTVVGMNIIELHAGNDMKKLNETFLKYLKGSLFLIVPFSFVIALNAEAIISVFFERGKFTRDSVLLTGAFLRYFILTLPYVLVNSFVVRLIIAKQIQRVSFWWQTSQSLGNILVYWPMIHFFGFMGYPVGGLVADYVYLYILLIFLLKSQFPYIDRGQVLRFFTVNGLMSAGLAGAFMGLGIRAGVDGSFIEKLVQIAWTSLAFFLVNLAVGYITGINREWLQKGWTLVISGVKDKYGDNRTSAGVSAGTEEP